MHRTALKEHPERVRVEWGVMALNVRNDDGDTLHLRCINTMLCKRWIDQRSHLPECARMMRRCG